MAELLWSLGLLWQFSVSCWWDQDSCRRATGAVAPGFTKAPAISWLKHSSPRWGGSLRIQAGLGPRSSGGLGRAPGLSHSPTLPAAREDPLGGLLRKLPGGRPGHDPWPRAPLHERSWPGAPVFAGASLCLACGLMGQGQAGSVLGRTGTAGRPTGALCSLESEKVSAGVHVHPRRPSLGPWG